MGLNEGEAGRVQAVRDGDALVLDTGLSVRLAGIEAPRKAWKDRDADPFGDEAEKAHTLVAIGRKCRLYYGGLTRDKYERAIAHVFVEDEVGRLIWLNGHLVTVGAARVRTWADNSACVRDLYALETQARAEKNGLWALPHYDVLTPNELVKAPYGLAIVEGVVSQVSETTETASKCEVGGDGQLHLSLGLVLARSLERIPIRVGQKIRVRSSSRREKNAEGKYAGKAFLAPDHWGQVEVL